jgi:hypothetical protein
LPTATDNWSFDIVLDLSEGLGVLISLVGKAAATMSSLAARPFGIDPPGPGR